MAYPKVYVLSDAPGSKTSIPRGTERITGIFYHGQSNSVNGGLGGGHPSVTITSVVDEHRGLMLNTGFMGTQGTPVDSSDLVDFVPGVEKWKNKDKGTVGGSSFIQKALWDVDSIGLKDAVYVVRATGQSGQKLVDVTEGSVPMDNLLATVSVCNNIADRCYNTEFAVDYIRFAQGEADAGGDTPYSEYYAGLKNLIEYTVRSVRKITRQKKEPFIGLDILVAPDGAARNVTPITLAQVDILDEDIPVVPNCSPYWFSASIGFNDGQSVHWTANAKDHLVEFGARAKRISGEVEDGTRLGDTIRRYVYNPSLSSSPWEKRKVPFETSPRAKKSSFKKVGSKIVFTVPFAEGGLSKFEDYRGPATNDGFYWGGTETYTGVSIQSGEVNVSVAVQFNSTVSSAGCVLSYAVEPQNNTTDNAPDCFGSIFDNCLEPSFAMPSRTLRQGLLPFQVTIA